MTEAATPKGERRRFALVQAAADLLTEGGFDAVRHRAVAARANLPLASTTYYFESLDDLNAAAVELCGMRELDMMEARIAEVSQRNRGVEATVELIVDMLVGVFEGGACGREQLVNRYERFVAFARHPELREVQLRLRAQLDDLLVAVLRRSGREVRQDQLRRLVCVVDGAVVGALSESDPDPKALARDMLLQVIDIVAPPVSA
ncbi:TetR family transcriptional regulator [Rhodococcus spelaei]|uniref:TetR family transcriptional regulator n=1 Tax=Rhodococcus spelaei TaxID=2546320 RepID=A0A541BPQ5_9NOCA|nr:TetR family transcriptional regulator [Rhodococcus spelaei]TQF74301.1 TetR family transcriptional regulator [Rhodococcus spelaei]